MNVSAIIVTRGNVDLDPVLGSLPREWEQIVWDNSAEPHDLSVYGRYAAIEKYASYDVCYVQDDDVIVSDPQAIVDAWRESCAKCAQEQFDPSYLWQASGDEIKAVGLGLHVCANQPQEFRHDGYTDSCLVGFGAVFHRDLPWQIFERFKRFHLFEPDTYMTDEEGEHFRRTCDVVFTTLAPARVLVDVPKVNREFAEGTDRMYKQPRHVGERQRMLGLARMVRDAR